LLRRSLPHGYAKPRNDKGRKMKFSYSAVWNDAVAMLKAHGSLIAALAGVFLLLPTLLTGHFLPQPAPEGADAITPLVQYLTDNWMWLLLGNIVNMIGLVAIYLLLLGDRGRTVGGAIAAALPIVPFYFLMSMITNVAIGFGLVLFILPGLYLLGRFFLASPVLVADHPRNPIAAIQDSWRLTRGHGWALAGLIVIIFLVGMLISFVVTAIVGSLLLILGGQDGVGGLLVLILSSALTAALYTILAVVVAAAYRALKGAPASAVDLAKGI
jgi:hypothetical protein